jgi:anion-transporting  ArsA/GET3 family ATPase
MNVATFCRKSRVLVVAGKGGVGKTTITAALARMASEVGLSVLVVDLEGKAGVPTAFGGTGALGYEESELSGAESRVGGGTVRARRITPDDALLEYLADHGMKRISKRLLSSGALDVVSTAIPGIRDILVLGKVKSLERQGIADLILVDAPATGHAMTFLSSAQGLMDAARSGPVRTQAADVVELLSDPDRCQVALVTLPEEMPVNEVVEAAYALEDRIGISLGPVIVNACLPADPRLERDPEEAASEVGVALTDDQVQALRGAADFRGHRYRLQEEQRGRLATELPLPQLQAPFLFSAGIGPGELDRLAQALAEAVRRLPDPEVPGPDTHRRDPDTVGGTPP